MFVRPKINCFCAIHFFRLGAQYRANGSVGTEQDIRVAKIIIHENYDTPLKYSNDIALINLVSPANIGKGVGLVCLPDSSNNLTFDNITKRCWIIGWGTLSSEGSSPNTLMQASVPLVSKQRCRVVYPGKIDDSMLCAGLDEGGVDACHGDSGGPLVCEFNGKWYLEGVTSWGEECALGNKYGVYANVRNLKSWLSTFMHTVVEPSVSPQNQSSSALGKHDHYVNISITFLFHRRYLLFLCILSMMSSRKNGYFSVTRSPSFKTLGNVIIAMKKEFIQVVFKMVRED